MIPLTKTTYDFETIEDQIVGAGILPVAIDDNGEIQILLGKERYVNHWRGSLKWSGFEGGRKSGETIIRTAAREFIEESIGVVPFLSDNVPTIDSVEDWVGSGNYVARIVLCILHGQEDEEKRYHVTYVMEVPYDADYHVNFSSQRRSFIEIQSRIHYFQRLNEQVKLLNVPKEGERYANIYVEAVLRVEMKNNSILCVEFCDDENGHHIYEFKDFASDAYVRWQKVRHSIEVDLKMLHADAFHVKRNRRGMIVDISINEDFLEKQNVQWWSIGKLNMVLKNGGYLQNDFFRAYFLPVMQQTLAILEECQ